MSSVRGVAVLMTGIIIAVLAAASFPLLQWIIKRQVTKHVVLANTSDSDVYQVWANPSILPDMYLQVYPWHLKNPEEVKNGAKASLEQRGPYTYREYRHKEQIYFNSNATVSYIEKRWFHFLPNMSVGFDNETFTTINIPLVVLANALRYESGTTQEIISRLLKVFKSEELFVTKSVRDMVFGYQDEMLKWAKRFYTERFYTDIVGVLAGKNNSYDGVFTIFTGEDDISKLGQIDRFNGSQYINFWSTDYANMVNGSADGSITPPFLTKDYKVYMFSMDICRSVYAQYYGTSYSKYGNVKLHRFRAPKEALEKPSKNPDNAGFCTPLGQCMGTGVLNISTCQKVDGFHIPIVISFPNFYMAEDRYINAVEGMNPQSDHATEIDLEPITGVIFYGARRMQINIQLTQMPNMPQFGNIQSVVLPILWVNESVSIDEQHAAIVKNELLLPKQIATIAQYVSIAVGITLFLIGYFIIAQNGIRKTNTSPSNGTIQNAHSNPQTSGVPDYSLPIEGTASVNTDEAVQSPQGESGDGDNFPGDIRDSTPEPGEHLRHNPINAGSECDTHDEEICDSENAEVNVADTDHLLDGDKV